MVCPVVDNHPLPYGELLIYDNWTKYDETKLQLGQEDVLSDFESVVFDDFSHEPISLDHVPKDLEYWSHEPIKPTLRSNPLYFPGLKGIDSMPELISTVNEHEERVIPKKTRKRRAVTPTIKLPDFVTKELRNVSGRGVYDVPETLVILFLACNYFPQKNAYAKIIASMGTPRTRNSVRRKIEKLVVRYMGNEDSKVKGLIKSDKDYDKYMNLVLEKYIQDIEKKMSQDEEIAKCSNFVKEMKRYTQSISL